MKKKYGFWRKNYDSWCDFDLFESIFVKIGLCVHYDHLTNLTTSKNTNLIERCKTITKSTNFQTFEIVLHNFNLSTNLVFELGLRLLRFEKCTAVSVDELTSAINTTVVPVTLIAVTSRFERHSSKFGALAPDFDEFLKKSVTFKAYRMRRRNDPDRECGHLSIPLHKRRRPRRWIYLVYDQQIWTKIWWKTLNLLPVGTKFDVFENIYLIN